jgi:hypothetical protein
MFCDDCAHPSDPDYCHCCTPPEDEEE